ncbi:MAG: hypothetical protein QXM83_00490, partial [Ignisphaera sp.]
SNWLWSRDILYGFACEHGSIRAYSLPNIPGSNTSSRNLCQSLMCGWLNRVVSLDIIFYHLSKSIIKMYI